MLKRLIALFVLALGALGVLACCLGIYVLWSAGLRLHRANDRLFAAVDKSLANSRDRLLGVKQRVQEAKLTADELGEVLRSWTAKQAAEQVLAKLDIESRSERLAQKLQQADVWLETVNESLEAAQQLLDTARTIGAPVDGDFTEEALEHLTKLRGALQQAQTTVEEVRKFTAKADDLASAKERAARVVQLIGRLVVTITEIDNRLGELASRLSEVQAVAGQFKARTSNYIVCATGVGVLFGAWMAVGQVTLSLYGWKMCRQNSR